MHFTISNFQKCCYQNLSLARCIQTFVIASILVLVSAEFASGTSPICISLAKGVPGILWNRPPNWWDASLGAPRFDTDLDAPNWCGALATTYPTSAGSGATEQASFRALYHVESGITYLYLSWRAKAVVSLTNDNVLYLGLHDATTSGKDVALKILLPAPPGSITANAISESQMTMYYKSSSGTTWQIYPSNGYDPDIPDWLLETAYYWIETNPQTWAFNLRIPISSGDGAGLSNFLDNGIHLSNNFSIWYELRSGKLSGGGGDAYTPYIWPRAVASITDQTTIPVFPATGNWKEVSLGLSNCSVEGVAIRWDDIGTLNAVPHEIVIGANNTFYARPRNQSMNVVNNIRARFRIANWGCNSIWEQDVYGNPYPDLWEDIGNPNGDPAAGISIAAATNSNDLVGTSGKGDINITWNPPASKYQPCNAIPDPNKKRCHQCILVTLSGTGVNFLNNSVFRNMDFVNASEFSRAAEINVKGISNNPLNSAYRDVYLHVVTHNMPKYIYKTMHDDYKLLAGRGHLYSQTMADFESTYLETNTQVVKDEDLTEIMPTYEVHAYYDSGERRLEGGINKPILLPMSSFGYFVSHDGDIDGWKYNLDGAEEIIPNYYRISVPKDSFTTIMTRIEALEPKNFGISLSGGMYIPHGKTSNLYKPNLSLTLELSYRLRHLYYSEILYMWHNFDGQGQIANVTCTNIIGNVRRIVPVWNWFNLFVNVGYGRYQFESGTAKGGYNVGGGLQFDFSRYFDIDVLYNYHNLQDTNPSFEYSVLKVIFRYHFNLFK